MALIAMEDGAFDTGTGHQLIRRGDTVTATGAQLLADIGCWDDVAGGRMTVRRFPI